MGARASAQPAKARPASSARRDVIRGFKVMGLR
jgi:hypothetical protein